jgi:hypoxanthine-DNA glycosylase
MTKTSYCVGLPPVVGKNAHTLVLGSMLGVKSLELRQYYAHPQNAFWKIMSALFDATVDTYAQRLAIIKNNQLALWDTLKCCIRPGSLDSEIDDASIEVNDFVALFREHPKITRVFFNGSKSESEFKKRVMPLLSEKIKARITFQKLPSTSPTHASSNFQQKLKAWRVITRPSPSDK